MYFPADPHSGILASADDLDGVTGKRPRLTPEERRERDRERTRRYRSTLSEDRKQEIRDTQRMKVAERRLNFTDDKRSSVRMQNAKRARERRAERKMAMVLAGVHNHKPAKRPSKRAINDKRTRALNAVREFTFGVFEPLVPTLGKARANRAAAAAAAVTSVMVPHISSLLPESDGHLLEDLDMDDEMNNLHALTSVPSHVSVSHHLTGNDTDSEDDDALQISRPSILPMTGMGGSLLHADKDKDDDVRIGDLTYNKNIGFVHSPEILSMQHK